MADQKRDDDMPPWPSDSADLVAMLDQTVSLPYIPCDLKAVQNALSESGRFKVAFLAGQRSVVDLLIDWMNAERRKSGEGTDEGYTDEPGDSHVRVIGPDGDVHSRTVRSWLAEFRPEPVLADGSHGRDDIGRGSMGPLGTRDDGSS